MVYRQTISTLMTVAALGLALWTSLIAFKRPQDVNLIPAASLPDAYMEDVTALIMDKQGRLKMKVVTPKMEHFTGKDVSYLTKPNITLYRHATWPWYITAKTAVTSKGLEQVDFNKEVVIHHPSDAGSPATIIKTNKLTVFPNQQIAQTAEFITMDQPNLLINAVGMIADMDKGSIKLLSAAKGQYEAQKS